MRVLVVDDEPSIRESLRRGLVAGGWTVDTAPDGEIGLEMACDEGYDVVVLDIMMPRRNGYEVVREMRGREVWTPVLMLTAKDGEYDQADAFDLGAEAFLARRPEADPARRGRPRRHGHQGSARPPARRRLDAARPGSRLAPIPGPGRRGARPCSPGRRGARATAAR